MNIHLVTSAAQVNALMEEHIDLQSEATAALAAGCWKSFKTLIGCDIYVISAQVIEALRPNIKPEYYDIIEKNKCSKPDGYFIAVPADKTELLERAIKIVAEPLGVTAGIVALASLTVWLIT